MYIESRAGLGESKQEPITTSAGDVVGPWLCQGMVPGGIIRPDEGGRVIGLKVIFRRSFADFRREVQRAVERVVTDPRVASKLVTASENLLKAHHKQMLAEKVPDNAPCGFSELSLMRRRVALGVLLNSRFRLSGCGGSACHLTYQHRNCFGRFGPFLGVEVPKHALCALRGSEHVHAEEDKLYGFTSVRSKGAGMGGR
jgi:hypothetical protein